MAIAKLSKFNTFQSIFAIIFTTFYMIYFKYQIVRIAIIDKVYIIVIENLRKYGFIYAITTFYCVICSTTSQRVISTLSNNAFSAIRTDNIIVSSNINGIDINRTDINRIETKLRITTNKNIHWKLVSICIISIFSNLIHYFSINICGNQNATIFKQKLTKWGRIIISQSNNT